MNRPVPSANEVVTCVLEAWRAGTPDESVVAQLFQLGLEDDAATNALELVRSGIMRAALIDAGLPPQQISSDLDDDPIFRCAVKAARAELSKVPKRKSADMAQLLADLQSEDISVRQTAAYQLGDCHGPAATAGLVSALRDADLQVRVYAIQSLARRRARSAVEPCSEILRCGAPRLLLINAIKALAEIGDPQGVPALIDATRHENAFVRHDAAWALGEIRDSRAASALEALLGDDTIPVEKDEYGLTTHSSMYSVADQARRSLKKISAGPLGIGIRASTARAVSLVVAAAGLVILGATAYAYFMHNVLSISGAVCASVAFVFGGLGLLASSKTAARA